MRIRLTYTKMRTYTLMCDVHSVYGWQMYDTLHVRMTHRVYARHLAGRWHTKLSIASLPPALSRQNAPALHAARLAEASLEALSSSGREANASH